jgi:general secretion pathway protein A
MDDLTMNPAGAQSARIRVCSVALLCYHAVATCLLLATSGPVWGASETEARRTAQLLALLLDSGRVVIDRNQSLIDDSHKGAKGFTAEVFERQLKTEFKTRSGVDLNDFSTAHLPIGTEGLLLALVRASKEVVNDAQFVINQRGIGYKNFIPATFGSQAARRFSAGSPVRLKQTALSPRNPKNEPDPYEEAVLRQFAAAPGNSDPSSELADGSRTLRLLIPIYYEAECMGCHGEPKGVEDISGYPKEGRHVGELAGAISVTIPLQP